MVRSLSATSFVLAFAACVPMNADRAPSPPDVGDAAAATDAADSAPSDADTRDTSPREADGGDGGPSDADCHHARCGRRATLHDFTGDGRADLATVHADGLYVAASTGSTFAPPSKWISTNDVLSAEGGALVPPQRVLWGDVTGDGRTDAVLFDDFRLFVMESDGTRFLGPVRWNNDSNTRAPTHAPSGEPPHSVALADVTGDGKADAVFTMDDRIYVMVSEGNTFQFAQNWTDGAFFGDPDTPYADLDGDGRDDAIAARSIYDQKLYSMRSTATTFDEYGSWSDVVEGTFRFADVTGDGKADAVVISQGNVFVQVSSGLKLVPNGAWTTAAGSGDVTVLDVNGDGTSDLAWSGPDGVDVSLSDGAHFAAPARWLHSQP